MLTIQHVHSFAEANLVTTWSVDLLRRFRLCWSAGNSGQVQFRIKAIVDHLIDDSFGLPKVVRAY